MFVRPTGIVPGYAHFADDKEIYRRGWHDVWRSYRYRRYGYHWDDFRRGVYTYFHGEYERDAPDSPVQSTRLEQTFKITKTTRPTFEEQHLIDDGAIELPVTINENTGVMTENIIHRYQDGLVEIIRRREATITGFEGIAVARTCKQLMDEVSDAVYGGNTFVFDDRDKAANGHRWDERQVKEFNGLRYKIPGLPDKHGHPPSRRQIDNAIVGLFGKSSFQSTFNSENPFLRFCYEAGPEDVARLTKIKFQGHFKTALHHTGDDVPIGLARLLPMYSTILKHCGYLWSLTLNVGSSECGLCMGSYAGWPGSTSMRWEVDPALGDYLQFDNAEGENGKSEEAKIDNAVRKIVQALPQLKHLQLGDYKKPDEVEGDLKWGKAVRWMDVVNNRPNRFGQMLRGLATEVPDNGNRDKHYESNRGGLPPRKQYNPRGGAGGGSGRGRGSRGRGRGRGRGGY